MKAHLPLALALLSIAWTNGQQPHPAFKVSVNTQCVNVVLMAQTGHALPDLEKEDFILFENKKRQEITHFFASDSPRAIGFLIATPCIGERLHFLRQELGEFISLLARQDRVMVVNYGRDLKEEISLTSDRRQVDAALAELRHRDPPCQTGAAINWTLERLAASEPGNRIMIMIANEISGCLGRRGGRPSEKDTLELAERSGVTIYVVFLSVIPMRPAPVGWAVDPNSEPKPELLFLRGLAGRTGGVFFDLSNRNETAITAGLRPALNAIADELKRVYTLAYSTRPGNKSAKRRVEVKVSRPGVKIRAAKKEY